MSAELITYSGDRRCVLGGAEAIRSPIYTNTWTKIRIGLQLSFDGVASSITGTPRLIFGVCRGTANVLVAATSDHVFGTIYNPTTFTHAAGPPATLNGLTSIKSYKRVGSTITSTSISNIFCYFSNDTSIRSGFFLEITKGSPNYTFDLGYAGTAAAAQSDLTDTQFLSIMQLTTMNSTTITAVKPGYGVTVGPATAVNEGTDGALDHIFVYWERTSHKFTFNLRHRMVA